MADSVVAEAEAAVARHDEVEQEPREEELNSAIIVLSRKALETKEWKHTKYLQKS